MAVIGTPACFVINAASFGAVILSLAMMRADEMVPTPRAPRARGQIREGFRYAVHTPELAAPLLMLTVTGVLAHEFPTTLPLLATDTFGGTAATYGIMSAVMAVGAVLGGVITTRPHPRDLAVTCLGWGTAILLTGLAPSVWTACIALAVVGYGSITFNSNAKTTLQLAARPELRGRSWPSGRSRGAEAV